MIWAWFLWIFLVSFGHTWLKISDISASFTRFFFFRTPKLSSSCHGGFQWFSSSRHLRQFWTQYRQVIHSHGCLGHRQISRFRQIIPLVIHQVEKMEVGNGWYMMVDLYGIYIYMVNRWIIYQYCNVYIYILYILVGGFKHDFYFP